MLANGEFPFNGVNKLIVEAHGNVTPMGDVNVVNEVGGEEKEVSEVSGGVE